MTPQAPSACSDFTVAGEDLLVAVAAYLRLSLVSDNIQWTPKFLRGILLHNRHY